MTATEQPARPPEFIVTREYRRFVEFCDACRQARYIGLCYGVPGVGKSASARQYARWDELEAVLGPPPHRHDGIPPPDSGPWQTILYTPGVVNTPRIIERDVGGLWRAVFGLARRAIVGHPDPERGPRPPDLIVVDEADRLKQAGLEQLRELLPQVPPRINNFLSRAAALARARFGGRISYASLPFEGVDWTPFDIVSTDAGYRSADNAQQFCDDIRAFRRSRSSIIKAGRHH